MSYYYAKEGQARGPVDLVELIELATTARLLPDDLVNRAGEPAWIAARELPELPFPPVPTAPPLPVAPPLPGAAPLPGASAMPTPGPAAATVAAQPPRAGWASNVKTATAACAAKVRPLTQRVQPFVNRCIDGAAQFMGLERIKVIPILLGSAASLLVLFSTLLVWWAGGSSTNMFGIGAVGDHYRYRGISYVEGKLVFMAIVGALVAVGLGAMRKNWMPPALLAAAAAAMLSMVVLFGVRSNLKANAREALAQMEQYRGMMDKITPDMMKAMDQQFYATVGWGLIFGVLAALGAAAAYIVAGVLVPQRLALFADKGPLMEHYAALIGSQLLAFLAGVIVVVVRY